MKLVEIKDVRVGQIWENEKGGLWMQWDDSIKPPIRDTKYYARNKETFEYLVERENRLIGFLGITHEIKGNKLVEIKQKLPAGQIFSVEDVVKIEDGRIGVIVGAEGGGFAVGCMYKISCGNTGFYNDNEFIKKIGIFGVTHEFVNERLVK